MPIYELGFFIDSLRGCPEQQVFVELRAFDYSLDEFGADGSGGPATKAGDAVDAVSQIAFKAFDSAGAEVYSATQSSGDAGFGTLSFTLAPGSYTFVAVGNKLSASAPSSAMVSISSVSQAALLEALPTDVFSLAKSVTIEPRTTFATVMTLSRVMSQFKLITTINLLDVPMKRKRITTATGTLFDAGGSGSFSFENTWLDPYKMTF